MLILGYVKFCFEQPGLGVKKIPVIQAIGEALLIYRLFEACKQKWTCFS